ncbi:MAG TPA: amino acid ABC transporter substrate-binding protein, partial [Gammaproteobacteria bacterium]|nr:amino acid ABC transporter substrate-binding protein [Gammaproteobacteria bacterium]
MKKMFAFSSAIALLTSISAAAYAGATLDAVKKKGFIQCGVNTGVPGFAGTDDKGNWKGIDVDVCRAAAAAVFGDASKVQFTPLTASPKTAA